MTRFLLLALLLTGCAVDPTGLTRLDAETLECGWVESNTTTLFDLDGQPGCLEVFGTEDTATSALGGGACSASRDRVYPAGAEIQTWNRVGTSHSASSRTLIVECP